MIKAVWVGSYEESLHRMRRDREDRVVFFVSARVLRRLSVELGRRAVSGFGVLVNAGLGDVYAHADDHQAKISMVAIDGIHEFDISDDVWS